MQICAIFPLLTHKRLMKAKSHHKNFSIPTYDLPSKDKGHSESLFDIMDIKTLREKYKDYSGEPHKHNYHSIFWLTRASGDVILDAKQFNCENNTLLIIQPGQVANPQENWETDGWVLSVSCMFSLNWQEQLSAQIFNTLNSASMIHITEANEVRLMTEVFRELDMEANVKSGFAHNALKDFLLYELLICVCREIIKANAAQELANSSRDSVFAQFQRLVLRHYKDMHSVSEYAKMIGAPIRALSAATEEKVHCSPLKYLHGQISTEAKRELLYTPRSIKEIAFGLGFAEVSHFIKFFKRQTGETPLQFRKRHKVYFDDN